LYGRDTAVLSALEAPFADSLTHHAMGETAGLSKNEAETSDKKSNISGSIDLRRMKGVVMSPPDSIPFQVVFDVTRQVPQYWWLSSFRFVMIVIGLGVFRKKPTATHRVFIVFFLGFAIFLALLQSILIWKGIPGLRSALARGEIRTRGGRRDELRA
jgi:hypothetical protein